MSIVKGKNQLCSCERKFFKSEQGIEEFSLFDRYDALETIVKSKIDEKYQHFLAQPLREKEAIIWYSIPFSEIPKQLSALSGEEKEKYEKIKSETLAHYKNVIESLKKEEKIDEADYLEKAIKFVNDNFVYCYDNKTILGIWGIQLRDNVRQPLGIAMKHLFKSKQSSPPEPAPLSDPEPEEHQPIPHPNPEPEEPKRFTVNFNNGSGGNLIGNSVLYKQDCEIISESEVPKIEVKEGYEFTGWDKNPIDFKVTGDTEFIARYNKIEPTPPIVPYIPWYKRFWEWLKMFFIGKGCLKWLLWLLLFLLLLLLLSWLFRRCTGTSGIDGGYNHGLTDDPRTGHGGIYNPGDPYTPKPTPSDPNMGYGDILPPDQGVLPPVDTTKIIREPEKPTIIGNRLNILMENEDKSIMQFAKDFKIKYPDEKYKVVYYDDVVKRVQIEMPSEERVKLKQEIPSKFLPDYQLFVFDETLFEAKYNPKDPLYADKNKSWYLYTVKAPQAWDITRGSSKIQVAIVDNGFSLNHPELRNKVVMPYNVWTHSKEIFPQKIDHGTHVAGIALALMDNGEGLTGIAPECQFMPVQVADAFGFMTTTSVLDGILYSLYQGADVVNVSLGTNFSQIDNLPIDVQRELILNHFKEEERLWNEIFRIAEKHEATIVVAAGNNNILTGIDPLQRPKYIITVSAVNRNNNPYSKANFSNYGSHSTISAPGVDIISTVGNNNYTSMNGTSMAAAIVSGGIALMKSLNDSLTNSQVIKILQTTGLTANGNIGKLIQLDKALEMVKSGKLPEEDICEKIANRIDSLQREIERLKKLCPKDTMTMNDLSPVSLNGRWKTIDPIYNLRTKEPIVNIFEFNGNFGQLTTLESDGHICKAQLSINVENGKLKISQKNPCLCNNGSQYVQYAYLTYPDKNGKIICEFQNLKDKSNFFESYLVKIN
jgi:subtilisin family serine protease